MRWGDEHITERERRSHAVEAIIYACVLLLLVGLLYVERSAERGYDPETVSPKAYDAPEDVSAEAYGPRLEEDDE